MRWASRKNKSMFQSATVWAAIIGCVSAVLSAVLPWWLGSHRHEAATAESQPVPAAAAERRDHTARGGQGAFCRT